MAKTRDYYEVLGVQRNASTDQIRSAYRKLARQFHPDINKSPDAAKQFAEVQEAYDVLSEEEKRRAYDQFGHAGVGAGPTPGSSDWAGFRNRAHAGRSRTSWGHGDSSGGVGSDDLGDIFEEIFGQRGRGGSSPFGGGFGQRSSARAPQRGRDTEFAVSVSFMTAALGGSENIRINADAGSSTISVKIPAGIDTGGKLRLKGKGQPGAGGGAHGDLILTIEVGKHPYFRRDGLDLYIDVPITIAEAVLGASVQVPLLKGEGAGPAFLELKVPPGTSSGRRLRIRGKGITDATGKSGDYYAVVQIVAPAANDLSESDRSFLVEVAKQLQNPRNTPPFVDEHSTR